MSGKDICVSAPGLTTGASLHAAVFQAAVRLFRQEVDFAVSGGVF